MACPQCSPQDAYDGWDSPQGSPVVCRKCREKNKLEKQIKELKELKASTENSKRKLTEVETQNKELKASLKFLRHKFENDPTLGIRDGDVGVVVHGVTDQPLPAHKFILASRSEVFQKIFETNMQEKETGILWINDATLPVVRAVIKFCYNAEIEFTDEVTSEKVLEVAHKYGIDLLRRKCEEDLTATISEGNLPKRLKLARKFESTGLEAAASQFFKDNFDCLICDVLSEFC